MILKTWNLPLKTNLFSWLMLLSEMLKLVRLTHKTVKPGNAGLLLLAFLLAVNSRRLLTTFHHSFYLFSMLQRTGAPHGAFVFFLFMNLFKEKARPYNITNQKIELTRISHNDFEQSNGEPINCKYIFSIKFRLLPHDIKKGIVSRTNGIQIIAKKKQYLAVLIIYLTPCCLSHSITTWIAFLAFAGLP